MSTLQRNHIYQGNALDVLKTLPDESAHSCITSVPYWNLRSYGCGALEVGREATPEEYIDNLVFVFREVRRVLHKSGTLWLNIGDTYAGGGRGGNPADSEFRKQATNAGSLIERSIMPTNCKPKDLIGIPWMLAFALRKDGWYLRLDIIWNKVNSMPESVTDRCTKSHEYIFLLSKSEQYYFDNDAIAEPCESPPQTRDRNAEGYNPALGNGKDKFSPGMRTYGANGMRNKRSVWSVSTKPYSGAHFATYPVELILPCIQAGTSEAGCCPECFTPWVKDDDDIFHPACKCKDQEAIPCCVLDPFFGSGTTGVAAQLLQRAWVGIELNPEYVKLAQDRIGVSLFA